MRAAAVPVTHVAGPFHSVDSSAPSPSGQLRYKSNCPNASGCLATQASRAQPGCSSSLHRGSKRTDVGWLSKQRLGSNALAESSNNVARGGGRAANARAVMVPVRPREPTSIGDSGNGATMRTLEGVSTTQGVSGVGLVNARSNGTTTQTVAEDSDGAEARASLRAAGVVEYDPVILSRRFGSQPFKVVGRALQIGTGLGTFALTVLLDKQRGLTAVNMRKRAIEFRERLTKLGPTFVKVGQGLSTRPDLCPPEYLEELAELQDALPTFSTKLAFECIEKELGMPLETAYSSITAEPIAAASLGQVYKAVLRSTGETVAVKVQRPGIEEQVGLDFYLVRGLTALIDRYVDIITSNVTDLLDEFARRVYQELNYVQEARNAKRFKALYGDRSDVLVPGMYWDYTSVKVLTMEWVEGTKLSEQARIEQQGLNILKLVDTGIQCSLRQLLEHGYFHADPHPGNLLATPDGRLAFLDFGMMSETPASARFAIIGHVVHLVNRDYDAMARDYYDLNFLSRDVDVSPIVPALQSFFDDVLTATVSELNFKTIVDGLGSVLYQYPFNVPAYYALILRSLTVLEGLALYTDPNFKVLAASYPYFAKRLLTDQNPYLRNALIELLFKDGTFRWNRLENLLTQGRKDSDFQANEVVQPIVELLLGQEGDELQMLIESEVVRVSEALILGTVLQTVKQVPAPLRAFLPPIQASLRDQATTLALREQVLRIYGLLQSSRGFDPAMLQPLVEVLMRPKARAFGGRVASSVSRRLAARTLQQLLRSPSSSQPTRLAS
ncbi:hypothetical protein M758_6G070100 [Ceratodon purpureus]|nr:hypothetical protein M758_6G070100 [Ceratodon purpureus]